MIDEQRGGEHGVSSADGTAPRIEVTEHGPYKVTGDVAIYSAEGDLLRHGGVWHLCRCGGSRNKPFCDITHGLKHFDGTERADHGPIARRRDSYAAADGVTVYDDRTVCCHYGQCTRRRPAVFRADAEPFVDPHQATAREIIDVVRGCPSGALAYGKDSGGEPIERHEPPSITATVDGPYRVRGAIQVIGADGRTYERRERQVLCRCGLSRNKPFCDGSHWYAGFRDPLPPELVKRPQTLYEALGGIEALERLTSRFYAAILSEPDPLLEPVFRGMDPNHPKHVAAWLAETFGGPQTYSLVHGGYEHMLAKHRGLAITEEQRKRWIARMSATADDVGLSTDPGLRSTLIAYLEWGTRLAVANSQPDAEVVEHAPIPHWDWGNTPPFEPQPWDDPDAAERGRRRYAEEQAQRDKENRFAVGPREGHA
jgi:CDGSH-type Zn-finger protein/truncated hemoglobin YjbI